MMSQRLFTGLNVLLIRNNVKLFVAARPVYQLAVHLSCGVSIITNNSFTCQIKKDGLVPSYVWPVWGYCYIAHRFSSAVPSPKPGKSPVERQTINPVSIRDVKKEADNELPPVETTPAFEEEKPTSQPGLFARFKEMYRNYWYVLVPVHVVTSTAWFGSFYYLAESGLDLNPLVDALNLSGSMAEKLKYGASTTAGYVAVAYALYKLATPLRYTVTLGGTTVAIKYLTQWGLIKKRPIPRREDIKHLLEKKKDEVKLKVKTKGRHPGNP